MREFPTDVGWLGAVESLPDHLTLSTHFDADAPIMADKTRLYSIQELSRRRNQLLDEIKRSEIDSQALNEPEAEIFLRKKRYNNLVDDLIQMERGPFTDPLESLPVELWIKIIAGLNDDSSDGPNPINQLLTLTCISKAWSDALLSVPSFWTTVILDGHEDSFAKAITSIQLSGTMELDVTIMVPSESWREMAPMVIPHRERIRTLKLGGYRAPGRLGRSAHNTSDILQIIRSFGQLPVLRNVLVIDRVNTHPPHVALPLELMPSLQTVKFLPMNHDTVENLRHSEIQSIEIMEFDKRMVQALVKLPHLRQLRLSLSSSSVLTDRLPTSTVRLPITSIYIWRASSYPLDSVFRCLGLELQSITVVRLDVARFFNTLSSLQQFGRLNHVSLYITQGHPPSGDLPDSTTSYYLPSVKSLDLTFDYLVGFHPTGWPIPWIDAIGRSLVAAFPSTESLVCKGSAPSGVLLPYIRKLTKLRRLVIECSLNTIADPPSSLVGEHLEYLNWTGSLPTDFFDHYSSPFLHTLHLTTKFVPQKTTRMPLDGFKAREVCFPTQHCRIPSIVTSNVTLLSLTMHEPAVWDLVSFPVLKYVQFVPSIWVSDFFEQLLLRPNDCPNLEHITIEGKYYEWDILLLMLERRVFAAKPGVASIKSITFNRDLSFTLLHAISELLRGKFPISIQRDEFSLEAIAHRMLDQSRPGCTRCCQEFQNCDSSTIPSAARNPFECLGLTREYDLPSRTLRPEPALTSEMEDWIARKRERRVKYTSECKNAKFHRIPDCARRTSAPSRAVTAYSMEFD